jgi:hypothetical protein
VPYTESGPLYLHPEIIKSVRESDWQRTFVGLLVAHGWKVFVDRMAWRSDPGWPDIFAVHQTQKRAIHCELKKEDGKLSPAQWGWVQALKAADQEVYVLRPSDWDLAVQIVNEGGRRDQTIAPEVPRLRRVRT